jgi:hypothetical protein
MVPRGWADLPVEVREAVEAGAGPVTEAESIDFGEGSEFKSVLETPSGRVFGKGATTGSSLSRRLSSEATINPYVAGLGPRLLWQVETGGWLVLGFAHVPGRHADYSPGSTDLVKLAEAVATLQELPCPDHVSWPVERRWEGFTEQPRVMAGQALLHRDLNPRNVLITEDQAHVVDWATPCRGADWVELALLVPRLIGHGHSPREAEMWAAQFPSWDRVTDKALDVFAEAESRLREKMAAEWPWPNQVRTANAAWQWARWRGRRR